jgi:hypothetical protein
MELIPRVYERKSAPRPVRVPLAPRVARCPAVTQPGDLVVDPAAGSFVVMLAARQLGCTFICCDLKLPTRPPIGVVAEVLNESEL